MDSIIESMDLSEKPIKCYVEICKVNTEDPWITAHSQGTANIAVCDVKNFRTLFRIKMVSGNMIGIGSLSPYYSSEPGPKKYENPEAILSYLKAAFHKIEMLDCLHNPFSIMKENELFVSLKNITPFSASGMCGIDLAIFDLWCNMTGHSFPLHLKTQFPELEFEKLASPETTFTLGIDSIENIEKKTNVAISRGLTKFKIKIGVKEQMYAQYGSDEDRLKLLAELIQAQVPNGEIVIADANCEIDVFGVEAMEQLAKLLAKYKVKYVEQPYPILTQINPDTIQQMKQVKKIFNDSGVKIIGDESFTCPEDIEKLSECFDVVNLKIMKYAGICNTLRALVFAQKKNLTVMFGCMVEDSISIGAASALCLSNLVTIADLDGNILLEEVYDSYRQCKNFGMRMRGSHWETEV